MANRSKQLNAAKTRPMPPAEIVESLLVTKFAPAHELAEWTRDTFLTDTGALFNPEHGHLIDASIGFMWASTGYVKAGRQVVGLTEDLRLGMRGNPFQKARSEQQLTEWFGSVPDFLITLDAFYVATGGDINFCALLEHELYHVGHKRDEFGNPAFTKDGRPRLGIRGHDVEEFVGVVERYGVGGPDSDVARLVIAAAKGPTLAPVHIAQACGTCMLRVA